MGDLIEGPQKDNDLGPLHQSAIEERTHPRTNYLKEQISNEDQQGRELSNLSDPGAGVHIFNRGRK